MDYYKFPDEVMKVNLDDNNVPIDEVVHDEKAIFAIFGNKNCPDEDLEISSEDNRRRFEINVTKEKPIKTENNQLSTTMNTNQKSINILPDDTLMGNETPKTRTAAKDTPTIKGLENSRKIFDISKVNKKAGRMPKSKKSKKFKAPHNKNSEDNIIRKIKAWNQENIKNCINYKYSKYMETKGISKKVKLLQRISPHESRKISKADNMKWFSTKLKDLFSSNLSQKCSLYSSDYNKCRIEEIYKNNEAIDVINILEKDLIEMYNLYRYNVKIEGFETLEDDLKYIRKKMEEENEEEEEDIEEYLLNYKNTALRLDKIFAEKRGRKKKKSKKSSL